MTDRYMLEGKTPVQCTDLMEWATWKGKANNQVASDAEGGISVSTIFLGTDRSCAEGSLILFETMIFGGEHDEDQWRYATWDEAEEGHKRACNIAGIHTRTFKAVKHSSRMRCHCGCKFRATHIGLANGIEMMFGCELSVRRWAK